jgi:hypothetical protein
VLYDPFRDVNLFVLAGRLPTKTGDILRDNAKKMKEVKSLAGCPKNEQQEKGALLFS